MNKIYIALLGSAVLSASVFAPQTASAESLSELIPNLLKTHQLVKASESDLTAATQRAREARGGWFPQLNVTADYGREKQDKPLATPDTDLTTRRLDLSVTQQLWDFGATSSAIRAARLGRNAAADNLELARQTLVLRAITAFLNVRRSGQVLEFARQSVENIRRQAELEDALVRRGAGLSTDVLQAKTQLAGAQARRVQSEGALNVNRNIYRAVFGSDPGSLSSMVKPKLPLGLLPQTVDEAVRVSLLENHQLTSAESSAQATRESVKQAQTGFLPRFDAVAQKIYKNDFSGTVGKQTETLGKVTMSFPFNLGFTATNTLKAARSDSIAADQRLIETRRLIAQQVRNSWQNLVTARENARLLTNQANIAAEFLELARRERQLGNRSLIDVLTGETALINANSDAASAETDVAIAAYSVLSSMGRLTADAIRE